MDKHVEVCTYKGRRYCLRFTHSALLWLEQPPRSLPFHELGPRLNTHSADVLETVFHAGLEGYRKKCEENAAPITIEETREVLDEINSRVLSLRLIDRALTAGSRDPTQPPEPAKDAEAGKAPSPATA